MNTLIYEAISLILHLNDRLYGKGASREVLRDLTGEWKPAQGWRDLSTPQKEY